MFERIKRLVEIENRMIGILLRLLLCVIVLIMGICSTIDWIIRGRESLYSQLNTRSHKLLWWTTEL